MNRYQLFRSLVVLLSKQKASILLIAPLIMVKVLVPLSVNASIGYDKWHREQSAVPTALLHEEEDTTNEVLASILYVVHEVKAGETLYQIANIYGVNIDDLAEMNRLNNPNYLQIGQQLTIPIDATVVVATPTPTTVESRTTRDTSQVKHICPDNSLVLPLALPADPIRLTIVEDQLYMVANGDLYRLGLNEMAAGQVLTPINLMPPDRMVGKYTIQELVYVVVDENSGDLLLLDKTNDIYRYSNSQQWAMVFPAIQVPGQFPDPQYLSIQIDNSVVYALDADLSRIWKLQDGVALPQVQLIEAQLLTGVDMLLANGAGKEASFVTLLRDGSMMRFGQKRPSLVSHETANDTNQAWPSQLFTLDDTLFAVDGEMRRIIGIDPNTQQMIQDIMFRIPDMQRLRSALIWNDKVYGLAGRNLYMADLSIIQECPEVVYDNNYYFDGINLLESLPDFHLPFPNTILPDRPRSYPGARRLYRYGIHEGLDLYQLDSTGLRIGSPVLAIADGIVVRTDSDFSEMSPVGYEDAITKSTIEHRTPPDLVDSFLGRQVHILHSPGVESRYGHLSSIAPEIEASMPISQGTWIGNVGVSGTSSGAYGTTDGAHLHFEIWIHDRYLGQGLSLYETVRLWKVVFGVLQ